jgi:2-polyprenyl-3-methyl-5-hydroxy-6-metoxy-1,4-benzoquinol methylase
MMNRKEHWENVYSTKLADEVSWYQQYPDISLQLIESAHIEKNQAIIDVGGGASVLAEYLLNQEFTNISVLDISHSALTQAKKRLAEKSSLIHWIESDVIDFTADFQFTLWHDRAVFHFLTQVEDRQAYIDALKKHVVINGHVIIATFSLEGPKQCSGLETVQYNDILIADTLGKSFSLKKTVSEMHKTPSQKIQTFSYFYFVKND